MIRGGVEGRADRRDGDYVEFLDAGASAKGEFQCSGCGYGVTIHTKLPVCPMCAGSSWARIAWSPFARAGVSAVK